MPNTRSKKRRSKRLQSGRRNDQKQKQQPPPCSDIEQQLQKQRRKRALQQEEQNNESPPPRALGDYRYDPSRKAYFPKNSTLGASSNKKKQKDSNQDCADAPNRYLSWHHLFKGKGVPSYSPHALLYAAETCPMVARNFRIRSWCALRQTLQGAEVMPTTQHSKTWNSMLSPYCATPFSCDE